MTRSEEHTPARVSLATKQAGTVRARWAWTKPLVWTDRMLTALENGVKGGQWFSLIDKVYPEQNLFVAFRQVAANKGASGVDHVTVGQFDSRLIPNLRELSAALRDGTYRPQSIRRTWIPKPGTKEQRPLGIPTVRDRVVQTALRNVLEPIFERDFAEHSYGFRPGRSCRDALRRVDGLLRQGYVYVVDADLKSYFDTIPHGKLMDLVRRKVSDGRVLALVEMFLKQNVLDGLQTWTPEAGSPQGAVISPLLSNVYLDPLDHLMAQEGFQMVRYADDFVILCRTPHEAEQALARVREWTVEAGLTLHPTKTHIVDSRQGYFEFLGYRFKEGRKWPAAKSLNRLKDRLREKTRRTDGRSLAVIIADVNRTLKGWFVYFQHCHKFTFERLDGWLRMRLRSVLRKRHKKRGRGRGRDHQRWPNAFFAEQGLYTLKTAHAHACQSSSR